MGIKGLLSTVVSITFRSTSTQTTNIKPFNKLQDLSISSYFPPITMHFTKTLVVLLLPLLSITSPTPDSSTDADLALLEGRASANLATLKNYQHLLSNSHSQITSVVNKLVGPSNNVAGQWTGTAGASFKAALSRYRSNQAKANAELADLASGMSAYISAINHHQSTNKKFFG
jgi:uncharacterized protein YukE